MSCRTGYGTKGASGLGGSGRLSCLYYAFVLSACVTRSSEQESDSLPNFRWKTAVTSVGWHFQHDYTSSWLPKCSW